MSTSPPHGWIPPAPPAGVGGGGLLEGGARATPLRPVFPARGHFAGQQPRGSKRRLGQAGPGISRREFELSPPGSLAVTLRVLSSPWMLQFPRV